MTTDKLTDYQRTLHHGRASAAHPTGHPTGPPSVHPSEAVAIHEPDSDNRSWRQFAQAMVRDQLKARDIDDPRVLQAMASVPRHRFMPDDQTLDNSIDNPTNFATAYDDRALPIGRGQTISQPYIVALMTSMLAVEPGMKVLEVGTGCGYQAAVLVEMGAEVVSIERSEELAPRAMARLRQLNYGDHVRVVVADGTLGHPAEAPYDRIIVTAGAPRLPAAYASQLNRGGRIVIPIGDRKNQRLILFQEHEGRLLETAGLPCRFVPLIGLDGWPDAEQVC